VLFRKNGSIAKSAKWLFMALISPPNRIIHRHLGNMAILPNSPNGIVWDLNHKYFKEGTHPNVGVKEKQQVLFSRIALTQMLLNVI